MINMRRVLVSMLSGALLLTAVGMQAGAAESDTAALAIAQRGLALGLQAADEVAADLEEGSAFEFAGAVEALEGVLARLEQNLSRNNGQGRGPERAIEVHQALLNGVLPSAVRTGEVGNGLGKAYGHLRGQLRSDGRSAGGGNPPDHARRTP